MNKHIIFSERHQFVDCPQTACPTTIGVFFASDEERYVYACIPEETFGKILNAMNGQHDHLDFNDYDKPTNRLFAYAAFRKKHKDNMKRANPTPAVKSVLGRFRHDR